MSESLQPDTQTPPPENRPVDELPPEDSSPQPPPRLHPGPDQEKLSQRISQKVARDLKVRTTCVRCKKALSVKVELLRRKLKCPACGTRMHIGSDGQWYQGHAPVAPVPTVEDFRTTTDFQRPAWWRSTKAGMFLIRHWQRARLIGIGIVVIALALVVVREGVVTDLPESLDLRAEVAVKAIVHKQESTLRKLADGQTRDKLIDWARAQPTRLDPATAKWKTDVIFQDLKGGKAATLSRVTSQGNPPRELVLQWTLGKNKLWAIDGQRTTDANR